MTILVDPYSVEEMVAAISLLLQDKVLRNELITKGKERSAGYSWDSACRQYLKPYEEIAHEMSLKKKYLTNWAKISKLTMIYTYVGSNDFLS